MRYFPLYINNQFVDASDGGRFRTRNAATGEPVSEFAAATAQDVDRACRSARAAFPAWSALDANIRAGYLLKIADGIKRRFREMAECEAMEAGKVIGATTTLDIPYSIEAFEYFAGICREIKGEVLPVHGGRGNKTFDFVTYEPYGVAAIIAPYNFPLHLMTRSMAPALAAGNTVVCKASSMTSSTLGILSEICAEAGLPEGVVNVVHGSGGLIGEALCMHPDVDVIGFTGSEAVGRQLLHYASCSPVMKKCVLELGGKGPTIVEPDCDMEEALNAQLNGFTYNQGEVCCAMTRLILHEDIYDEFLERLAAKAAAHHIGDPLDPDATMTCIIHQEHADEIHAAVQLAVEQGAKVYCGGRQLTGGIYDKGAYYLPTILTDVTPEMTCFQAEIFGPVLTVTKYKALEEAIALANNTSFGLGANLFTSDLRKAYWATKKLAAGTVWVNMENGSQMHTPFGGNKNSGMGREYGTYGLHEYLRAKNNVWNMRLPTHEPYGGEDDYTKTVWRD